MTIQEFCTASANSAAYVLIAGICISLYRFRKLDALHKNILFYLCLMLVFDTATNYIIISGNNFIVLFFYCIAELVFFVRFYNKHLLRRPNKIITGLGVIAGVYIITELMQYLLNPMLIKQYQPYAKVIENFVIIVCALIFYYNKMRVFNETRWTNFRLNTVILVFFTVNTVIFIPFNFLINESSGVCFYFWTMHALAISLFYVYLSALIWINGKTASDKIESV